MSKSVTFELQEKLYYALKFITRGVAIPKPVLMEAADAAVKVIRQFLSAPKQI